ncbi:hypothetical protein PFISCL1PPCAC_24622, partial [Pristionchus fissidentatus]
AVAMGSRRQSTGSSLDIGTLKNQTNDVTGLLYENVDIEPPTASKATDTPTNPTPSKTPSTPEESIELTPGGIPEKDAGVEARGEFSSAMQYLLACVGYAVGLGNIWRFPSVAYENGGGAFLIPYILCATFFGLPTLYIECSLGQFTQYGPSKAFQFYMPLSQGIGWAMSIISLSIALYYNVIVAWTMIYIGYTVSGNLDKFSSCDNYWNTIGCDDTLMCTNETERFFNGTCHNSTSFNSSFALAKEMEGPTFSIVAAPDEFFTHYIVQKHLNFGFGGFNWKIAGCLVACWVMTALGLAKGVKWLGKISLITATVPYLMIIVLMVRGVTLEGAQTGIEYYLTKPDFSKMFTIDTWKSALMQICFSLSVGQGGMLAMSSYNKRSHRCFRDAVLVMFADSAMSLIGGVAVFSVLGFMAKNSGKTIPEVVPSPLSLAFVAYPEAISHMPWPGVWSFLFFFMLFMLGISTMFGLVEGIITCLCDSSPYLRAHHALTVCVTCLISCVIGLLCFCSQNGFHFFAIFNEFIGSFSLAVIIVFEIIVIVFVYGPRHFFRDMEAQFGRPTTTFGRIFGSQGMLIKFLMCITAPIFAVGVLVGTLYNLRDPSFVDKIGEEEFRYPGWAIGFGLALAAVPLSSIPIFAIVNCVKHLRAGKGFCSAFRVAEDHPALRYNLAGPASFGDFWKTPLAEVDAVGTVTKTEKETEKQTESVKR